MSIIISCERITEHPLKYSLVHWSHEIECNYLKIAQMVKNNVQISRLFQGEWKLCDISIRNFLAISRFYMQFTAPKSVEYNKLFYFYLEIQKFWRNQCLLSIFNVSTHITAILKDKILKPVFSSLDHEESSRSIYHQNSVA